MKKDERLLCFISEVENVPIEVQPNEYDYKYLKTKKERMGHTLHL